MLQEDYSSTAYWYQVEPHDPSFGGIGSDISYVKPLGTRWEAHLISELVQDPPVNWSAGGFSTMLLGSE